MKHRFDRASWALAAAVGLAWLVVGPAPVRAHCDTMDGPVIVTAKAALEKGDVSPVLKWVKPQDEAEIRAAFDLALQVRAKGPDAQQLADTYFFETLVRVHRAGEGAPYTGIKPGGQQEEIVVAADHALDTGSADELIHALSAAVAQGVEQRFHRVVELKKHADESLEAGREYVEAYVDYVHYVERLHSDAVATGGHHAEETAPSHEH
jgi:hypothetical protein